MKVGVVGLGLIGGSILRRTGGLGWDASAAVRAAAAEGGARIASSLAELVAGVDLVVVAVPPASTCAVVQAVIEADTRVLVTDVASVKGSIAGRVDDPDGRFVAGHPLAGGAQSGWSASRPDLLDGAVWVVCPPARESALLAVSELADRHDARLVATLPPEHDRAVAWTSHVPHLVAQVLSAGTDGVAAVLSGPAHRDMTRVASSDPELWAGILRDNGDEVREALRSWIDTLQRFHDDLDGEAIDRLWREGAKAREATQRARWTEPRWERRSLRSPWDDLLALGRQGRCFRRVRVEADGGLSAEVSTP